MKTKKFNYVDEVFVNASESIKTPHATRVGAVGDHTPTLIQVVDALQNTDRITAEQKAFIVRAVNCHEELVQMVQGFLEITADKMAVLGLLAKAKGTTVTEMSGLKASAKAEGKYK